MKDMIKMQFLYENDVKEEDWFYPNDIKEEDLDDLKDWQLLVAACHFAPTMGDCVDLNYGYVLRHGQVFVNQWGRYGYISLKDDIDINNPTEMLKVYNVWQELARDYLEKRIKNV